MDDYKNYWEPVRTSRGRWDKTEYKIVKNWTPRKVREARRRAVDNGSVESLTLANNCALAVEKKTVAMVGKGNGTEADADIIMGVVGAECDVEEAVSIGKGDGDLYRADHRLWPTGDKACDVAIPRIRLIFNFDKAETEVRPESNYPLPTTPPPDCGPSSHLNQTGLDYLPFLQLDGGCARMLDERYLRLQNTPPSTGGSVNDNDGHGDDDYAGGFGGGAGGLDGGLDGDDCAGGGGCGAGGLDGGDGDDCAGGFGGGAGGLDGGDGDDCAGGFGGGAGGLDGGDGDDCAGGGGCGAGGLDGGDGDDCAGGFGGGAGGLDGDDCAGGGGGDDTEKITVVAASSTSCCKKRPKISSKCLATKRQKTQNVGTKVSLWNCSGSVARKRKDLTEFDVCLTIYNNILKEAMASVDNQKVQSALSEGRELTQEYLLSEVSDARDIKNKIMKEQSRRCRLRKKLVSGFSELCSANGAYREALQRAKQVEKINKLKKEIQSQVVKLQPQMTKLLTER